jgi:hypothetical protein
MPNRMKTSCFPISLKGTACLLIVILFLFSIFTESACASIFGASGGVKNESSFPIRMKLIKESGDYEWVIIARGSSYDFPEATQKVLFVRYENELPIDRGMGVFLRVQLTLGDGKTRYLKEENVEYVVQAI